MNMKRKYTILWRVTINTYNTGETNGKENLTNIFKHDTNFSERMKRNAYSYAYLVFYALLLCIYAYENVDACDEVWGSRHR